MTTHTFWAQALNIDDKQIEQWQAEAPGHMHLAHYCVLKGHVSPSSYLDWAREYFQLATLNDSFFKTEEARKQFSQLKNKFKFQPTVAPVGLWENTLFIACSDPMAMEPLPFKHQFILANPLEIHNLWQQQGQTETAKEVAAPAVSTPLASKPKKEEAQTPIIVAENSSTPPSLDDLASAMAANEPALPEDSASSADLQNSGLEGLDLSNMGPTGTTGPNESADPFANMLEQFGDTPTSNSNNNGAFEGLTPTPPEAPSEEGAPAGLANLNIPTENKKVKLPLSEDQGPEPLLQTEPTEKLTQKILDLNTATRAPSELDFPDMPDEITNVPKTTVAPEKKTASEKVTHLKKDSELLITSSAPEQLSQAKNLDETLAWYCNEIQQHYVSVMFLTCNNNEFKIWRHDNSWKVKENAQTSIPLNSPSLFKIVYKSKASYHGPLVANPVHDQFFTDFQPHTTPELVTATPVTVKENFWGVILCVGRKNDNSNQSLAHVESLAKQFAEGLSSGAIKAA